MIHPFAHFSAAPLPGESLWERAALLAKPAADFAEFLKTTGVPQTPRASAGHAANPQRAASSAAASRDLSESPARSRETGPGEPAAAQPSDSASADDATGINTGEPHPADAASDGPPRFVDVPDSAKFPAGPYRQAPAEYGGEWWLVSPFTGEQPWLNQELASVANPLDEYAPETLPPDFVQAFGEMPVRHGGESGAEFVARLARWKQDLEFFQQVGIPDGLDEALIELASTAYEQWGMGAPVFYEGRYGWFARFPDSAIPEFEMDAASAVTSPHLAIARFQVRQLQNGGEIPQTHPFVPPHLIAQSA